MFDAMKCDTYDLRNFKMQKKSVSQNRGNTVGKDVRGGACQPSEGTTPAFSLKELGEE